jgi:hypothetical protein
LTGYFRQKEKKKATIKGCCPTTDETERTRLKHKEITVKAKVAFFFQKYPPQCVSSSLKSKSKTI